MSTSELIAATIAGSPNYVISPGTAPLAPATGTGPVSASRRDMPLAVVVMTAIGIALMLLGVISSGIMIVLSARRQPHDRLG